MHRQNVTKNKKISGVARLSPLVVAISAALAAPAWGADPVQSESFFLPGDGISVVLVSHDGTGAASPSNGNDSIRISVALAENSGLDATSGLKVKVKPNSGLTIDGNNGLAVQVDGGNGGYGLTLNNGSIALGDGIQIEASGGTTKVKAKLAEDAGLKIQNSGLAVKLAEKKGLTLIPGNNGGLAVALDANSLKLLSNGEIAVKTGAGLTSDADGVKVKLQPTDGANGLSTNTSGELFLDTSNAKFKTDVKGLFSTDGKGLKYSDGEFSIEALAQGGILATAEGLKLDTNATEFTGGVKALINTAGGNGLSAAEGKLSLNTASDTFKNGVKAMIDAGSSSDIVAGTAVINEASGKKSLIYKLADSVSRKINDANQALQTYLGLAEGSGYTTSLEERVQGQIGDSIDEALANYTDTTAMNAALDGKADLTLSNVSALSANASGLIRQDVARALKSDASGDVLIDSVSHDSSTGNVSLKLKLSNAVNTEIAKGDTALRAITAGVDAYKSANGVAGATPYTLSDVLRTVANNDLSKLSDTGKQAITSLSTTIANGDTENLVVASEEVGTTKQKQFTLKLSDAAKGKMTQGAAAFTALKDYQVGEDATADVNATQLKKAIGKQIDDKITALSLGTAYANASLSNITAEGKSAITQLITSSNTANDDIVVNTAIGETDHIKSFSYSLNANIKKQITDATAAIADVTNGTEEYGFAKAIWSLKGLNAAGKKQITDLIDPQASSTGDIVVDSKVGGSFAFKLSDTTNARIQKGENALAAIQDAVGSAQNLQARLAAIDTLIQQNNDYLGAAVSAYWGTKASATAPTPAPARRVKRALVASAAPADATTTPATNTSSGNTLVDTLSDVGTRLNGTEAATSTNTGNIQALNDRVTTEVTRLDTKVDTQVARLDNKVDTEVARLDNKVDTQVARLDKEKANLDLKNISDEGKATVTGLIEAEGKNGIRVTSSISPDTKAKKFEVSLTNLDLGEGGSVAVGGTSIDKDGIKMLETSLSEKGLKVGNVDINKEEIKVGEVSIKSTGIDAANQPVRNVASGLDSGGDVATNAANIGDVSRLVGASHQVLGGQIKQLEREVNKVAKNADAGTATAMAVANLGQPFRPGQSAVSMGGASYNGRTGYAIGASRIMNNGRVLLKGAVSGNDRGKYGVAASATFFFD